MIAWSFGPLTVLISKENTLYWPVFRRMNLNFISMLVPCWLTLCDRLLVFLTKCMIILHRSTATMTLGHPF